MKKLYIFMFMALGFLSSCYDDKGGNDFDSPMADVEMVIPEAAYSASLGGKIQIEPIVKTSIPDDDLEFIWEARGAVLNSLLRETFTPLTAELGKNLDYTCHLDSNIVALNTSYTCRLHARQKSTGRDFYSSNTFTITISGVTGLMVLYGDDAKSDIGMLMADEFMPAANSLPEKATALSAMYSGNNNGQMLEGKGISIVHAYPSWVNSSKSANYDLVAQTTSGFTFANNSDFSQKGDWDYMFYLKGDKAVHHGKPEGFIDFDQIFVGFDDGELFMCEPNNAYPFLFPEIDGSKQIGDGNSVTLAPYLLDVASNGIQAIGYTMTVNGKEQKGFIGFSQTLPNNTLRYAKILDTKDDNVAFNPADMKASLVKMSVDDRAHVLAVLKGDANHARFAGKYFLADLYPNAAAGGASAFANVPQYLYGMSASADIDNAFAFAFGSTKNMCYYATPTGVYQYGVDSGTFYPATALGMIDGSSLTIDGDVTMLKMLDSPNVSTHNTEPILMVATWKDGVSALYALHLDAATGKVKTAVKYDKTTVEGWNFGMIRDANIKAM